MFKDWTSMRASERIYVEIFENTSKTEGKGMVLGTGGVKFLPAKSMDPREVMKKDLPRFERRTHGLISGSVLGIPMPFPDLKTLRLRDQH
eukprot:1316770-Amorphochlora_amoeboformis.AAC.1